MSAPAKHVLILPLCLSVVLHVAILFAGGLVNPHPPEEGKDVLTVELNKTVEATLSRQERKRRLPPLVRPRPRHLTASATPRERYDTDTVDLGDKNSPYTPYLKQLRRRIEKIWEYPEEAYARKEEGVTVVRFSVAKNGGLGEIDLMASSGSSLLDEGTIRVIRAAAPYEPLPGIFAISRLNIVAAFRYRLAP